MRSSDRGKSDNGFKAEGCSALAALIANIKFLRFFILEDARAGDDGMQRVFEALYRNTEVSLKGIVVRNCDMKDAAGKILATLLGRVGQGLQYLDFSHNPLTQEAGEEIVKVRTCMRANSLVCTDRAGVCVLQVD